MYHLHQLHQQYHLVHQVPSSSSRESTNELSIRRKAVDAIIRYYKYINSEYDYPNPRLKKYSFQYKYNGWYTSPMFPSTVESELLNAWYGTLQHYTTPLLNSDLDKILGLSNIEISPSPNKIMGCTASFYMTSYAILYAIIPEYIRRLLDISVVDQMMNNELISQIHGYDTDYEIDKLNTYYQQRKITDTDLVDINKVLLYTKKAKRLFTVYHDVIKFLNAPTSESRIEYKVGDGYYIYGHPSYDSAWGDWSGWHVYCIGFEGEEPLFIGFCGNQINNKQKHNYCEPLKLSVIQDYLAEEYIDALIIHKPDMVIKGDELQIIKSRPVEHTIILNIPIIQEVINSNIDTLLPRRSTVSTGEIVNQETHKYPNNQDLIKLIKNNN